MQHKICNFNHFWLKWREIHSWCHTTIPTVCLQSLYLNPPKYHFFKETLLAVPQVVKISRWKVKEYHPVSQRHYLQSARTWMAGCWKVLGGTGLEPGLGGERDFDTVSPKSRAVLEVCWSVPVRLALGCVFESGWVWEPRAWGQVVSYGADISVAARGEVTGSGIGCVLGPLRAPCQGPPTRFLHPTVTRICHNTRYFSRTFFFLTLKELLWENAYLLIKMQNCIAWGGF